MGRREGQELGFGWVKFELPLGHPEGDVGSAEIRVGVWKSGRSPGWGCKPRRRGGRRWPRSEWDKDTAALLCVPDSPVCDPPCGDLQVASSSSQPRAPLRVMGKDLTAICGGPASFLPPSPASLHPGLSPPHPHHLDISPDKRGWMRHALN